MNLSWNSETQGTIDCLNGHLLVVDIHHPHDVVEGLFAEVKNEAQSLPLTVLQTVRGLEQRGFVEIEWGVHRAVTLPVVSPTDAPAADAPDAPATPVASEVETPSSGSLAAGEGSLEDLGDAEIEAMAAGLGIETDGKDRAALIAEILTISEGKGTPAGEDDGA